MGLLASPGRPGKGGPGRRGRCGRRHAAGLRAAYSFRRGFCLDPAREPAGGGRHLPGHGQPADASLAGPGGMRAGRWLLPRGLDLVPPNAPAWLVGLCRSRRMPWRAGWSSRWWRGWPPAGPPIVPWPRIAPPRIRMSGPLAGRGGAPRSLSLFRGQTALASHQDSTGPCPGRIRARSRPGPYLRFGPASFRNAGGPARVATTASL